MERNWQGTPLFRRATAKNQFWGVAAGGGVAIILLVATLAAVGAEIDRASFRREQAVVSNGLISRVNEISGQVVPQAVWDEAVVHLDNRFSPDWARDNIGTYLHATNGFNFSWVLDADDRPVYGMESGADVPLDRYDRLAGSVARIVGEVRAAEARRADEPLIFLRQPRSAIVANATDAIGGELFVLSAVLVQPDFNTAQIRRHRAPVVVTGLAMDPAFVQTFSERYMLSGVHLHLVDPRAEAGRAYVSIANPAGQTVAALDWTPQRPGNWLLTQFLPMTMALLIGLLGIALIAYRKAHAAVRDVVASEQRAVYDACHDSLTGLGNRRALEARVKAAFDERGEGGATYALHCVDLDNFKDLNDTVGHGVGDELLRIAARRLRRIAGADDLCFRIGGDEFALLQPISHADEAMDYAERIRRVLSKRFALTTGRFQLTACVGIAPVEPDDVCAGDSLRKADLALSSAKRSGRGRIAVHAPEMCEALYRRRGLQEALRRDLERGGLSMIYQPQVDRDCTLIGVEALLRWAPPEFGPVSPSVFVSLAEEGGLIEELGAFALGQAFRDSLRWPGLKMAINVSAVQLRNPAFVERLVALAEDTGVSPDAIELELTEGVLVEHGEAASARLGALRDAGFSIAIDDFGTGYSSLAYLSRFPIGKIKIDRSFVTDMGQSRSADVLVSTILQLGRSLNMRVIAEGVETPDQWLRLAAVGCTEFQGYLTSRPVSADVMDRIYAGEAVEIDGQDARYAPESRRAA